MVSEKSLARQRPLRPDFQRIVAERSSAFPYKFWTKSEPAETTHLLAAGLSFSALVPAGEALSALGQFQVEIPGRPKPIRHRPSRTALRAPPRYRVVAGVNSLRISNFGFRISFMVTIQPPLATASQRPLVNLNPKPLLAPRLPIERSKKSRSVPSNPRRNPPRLPIQFSRIQLVRFTNSPS
jgi:hypothetical protein